MPLNKKTQCKTSYEQYLNFYSSHIISKMTPEAKKELAEKIQVRITLLGEEPENRELYRKIMEKLKS